MKEKGKSKKVYLEREPKDSFADIYKNRFPPEDVQEFFSQFHDLCKVESYYHQKLCTAIGLWHPYFLFALDMGLGKTKIALDIFSIRKTYEDYGKIKRCLVVASSPSMAIKWGAEVQKHTHNTAIVAVGKPDERLAALKDQKAEIVVCSKSSLLPTMKSEEVKNKKNLVNLFRKFDMIIIDEAHKLNNYKSKGLHYVVEYCSVIKYIYLLTGTPVNADYQGIWGLYYLMQQNRSKPEEMVFGSNYYRFLNQWYNRQSIPFLKFIFKKARKEAFFKKFWHSAIRFDETECNDLPEKIYENVLINLTSAESALYNRISENEKQKIIDGENGNLMEMVRLTGGVHDEMQNARQIGSKLQTLEEIIEPCIDADDWILVWCFLQKEGDLIVEHLKNKFKVPVGNFRGGVDNNTKAQILEDWKSGDLKVLVANQKSLGEGVDLYEANKCIFYSNSFSYIDRAQTEKRIHRTGQKRTCYYIDLICKGTIDGYIKSALDNKEDVVSSMTKDKFETKTQNNYDGRLW